MFEEYVDRPPWRASRPARDPAAWIWRWGIDRRRDQQPNQNSESSVLPLSRPDYCTVNLLYSGAIRSRLETPDVQTLSGASPLRLSSPQNL